MTLSSRLMLVFILAICAPFAQADQYRGVSRDTALEFIKYPILIGDILKQDFEPIAKEILKYETSADYLTCTTAAGDKVGPGGKPLSYDACNNVTEQIVKWRNTFTLLRKQHSELLVEILQRYKAFILMTVQKGAPEGFAKSTLDIVMDSTRILEGIIEQQTRFTQDEFILGQQCFMTNLGAKTSHGLYQCLYELQKHYYARGMQAFYDTARASYGEALGMELVQYAKNYLPNAPFHCAITQETPDQTFALTVEGQRFGTKLTRSDAELHRSILKNAGICSDQLNSLSGKGLPTF